LKFNNYLTVNTNFSTTKVRRLTLICRMSSYIRQRSPLYYVMLLYYALQP